MSYRDDVDALAARTEALAHEVAQRTQELDDARRLLDEARARARLPVLDNIRVAAPCDAVWDQMTGDDRVRHCHQCKLDVYNLSAMTRDEAQTLIAGRNGRLCVRYFQRTDGTILLSDCTIGKRRRRNRRILAAGVAALLGGAAAVAIKLTRPVEQTEPEVMTCAIPDVTADRQVVHESPAPPAHAEPETHADPHVYPKMGRMAFHEIKGDLY